MHRGTNKSIYKTLAARLALLELPAIGEADAFAADIEARKIHVRLSLLDSAARLICGMDFNVADGDSLVSCVSLVSC